MPSPVLITSPATLADFGHVVCELLALVERDHAAADHVDAFAAVPVSAAIAMGRALMPDVSPTLRVFDRGEGQGPGLSG